MLQLYHVLYVTSRTQTFHGQAVVRFLHFSYSYAVGSGYEIIVVYLLDQCGVWGILEYAHRL